MAAPRHWSDKPCKYGHIGERYSSNYQCVECLRVRGNPKITPGQKSASNKRYYAKNRETALAINARWRTENPERMKQARRNDYYANRETYNARARMRDDHIRIATPAWADRNAIIAVYKEAATLSRDTGVPHEVDHIEPLRSPLVCGLHVHWNLRAIPAEQNRQKSNRRG